MNATSNTISRTEAPVIIRVPVLPADEGMSVREAEKILKAQGFRPMTPAEQRRNKKFFRAKR
jgi:beta-lactam-binding protein with PASTA domain